MGVPACTGGAPPAADRKAATSAAPHLRYGDVLDFEYMDVLSAVKVMRLWNVGDLFSTGMARCKKP
jgi:hypothetical protein